MSDANVQRLFRAWLADQTPENAQRYVSAFARAGGQIPGDPTVDELLMGKQKFVRQCIAGTLRHYFGKAASECSREDLKRLSEDHFFGQEGPQRGAYDFQQQQVREFYKDVGLELPKHAASKPSDDMAAKPKNAPGWRVAFLKLERDYHELMHEIGSRNAETMQLREQNEVLRRQNAQLAGQDRTVQILRAENERLAALVQTRAGIASPKLDNEALEMAKRLLDR